MAPISFLSEDFGYVILCIFYTVVNHMYLAIQVGKARKKYKVLYPTMYSPDNNMFNCIQRAHQNTLESMPLFLVVLLLVGIVYPKFAAACGALYVTSRFSYAWGYYTGDPKKRLNGEYGAAGLAGLVVAMIYIGIRQLGCCDAYLPF
uniref:Glutathione S-transferase 3, mitochondrial n=1 Tax=Phallusia mammillata TaxID=59560 RepID=A0A6F9DLI1_9ASCI|nr:microsomal glutathione S-transferase 3-like [Phallusia mammillata]